jgi:hypothetical protein
MMVPAETLPAALSLYLFFYTRNKRSGADKTRPMSDRTKSRRRVVRPAAVAGAGSHWRQGQNWSAGGGRPPGQGRRTAAAGRWPAWRRRPGPGPDRGGDGRIRSGTAPGAVRGRIGADFARFGARFGSIWSSIWLDLKPDLTQKQKKNVVGREAATGMIIGGQETSTELLRAGEANLAL